MLKGFIAILKRNRDSTLTRSNQCQINVIQPTKNEHTFLTVACGIKISTTLLSSIFFFSHQGVAPTVDVFQAAMAACAKLGKWRECINTFENMRLCGLHPKV